MSIYVDQGFNMLRANIFALVAVAAVADSSQAAVLVNVRWNRIEVETSPLQQTHIVATTTGFRLEGKTISTYSSGGKYKSSGDFGDALETINPQGIHYLKTYNFRSNVITETVRAPGYTQTTVIRTDGVSVCSAVTTYHRLPGQKYFIATRKSNNETMYISNQYAEGESCQISSVAASNN